jgi:hypothetical protein
MTVSAKVRKSLPPSRMGKPGSDEYPMPDKKHARIAKGFAAMHDDPDKAAIDAKADAILAKKRGGRIKRQLGGPLPVAGVGQRPNLGRPGLPMARPPVAAPVLGRRI